ncbi:unnamed protein product, partial [Musa hybrid cultivar]
SHCASIAAFCLHTQHASLEEEYVLCHKDHMVSCGTHTAIALPLRRSVSIPNMPRCYSNANE